MDYFHRVDGDLFCEDLPVADLAARFGTPLYVYSRRTFVEHYEKLDRAFADVPHAICYSVKANGNLGVLRTLASLGCGADVVSGGELHRALLAGIPPERIVYSGVGKTGAELAAAVDAGIRAVNVENVEELRVLSEIATGMGRVQPCALRVNPDVDPHTHEYLTTGRSENKFGIPLAEVGAAAGLAATLPAVPLVGLDFHIGSQILSHVPYQAALRQAREVVEDLRRRGFEIRHLDIGGGLAVRYDHERPMTADEFHDGIIDLVRDLSLALILEPGRFIIGPAGVLVAEVLFVKEAGGKRFVILDAGMNDLIRPALYDAVHRIEPVRRADGDAAPADVVGPVCESGDFLGRDRALPAVRRGDLVAVMTAGAYGAAMSSNYNQRPRAAEVLVYGADATIVRRRETYEDLVRLES
ncbi:MAG: diaminopimelate decarboxylase [Deltaproteobacteria bacterium]|nr:diaminopimelate decarboxylase [Deltaproteobacteria bacterium]